MKSQNLVFEKNAMVELNDEQMLEVDGGTSPICLAVTIFLLTTQTVY